MSDKPTAPCETARPAEPILAVLAGFVVFHAAVQAIAVGLSLSGASLKSPVAETIVLVSAVAGFFAWRSFPRQRVETAAVRSSAFRRACRLKPELRTAPAAILPKAVLLLAGVTFATAWIVCWFRPDTSGDGNLYHIPTMHFWALEGRVHWIDWPGGCGPFMNGYPGGVELTGLVTALALHTSRLVNAVNLMFLPLGVLAAAYLARAVGASPWWSATAGAAWALIPMNVAQATTTYVDSAYASCAAALFALAFYTVACVAERGEFFPWRAVWPLGAAAGLAAAAKGTGAASAPIALAVVAACLAVGIVRHGRQRPARLALAAGAFLASAAAVAVLVGGYWYVRNYLMGGSPLYPVGLYVAGYEVFPGRTLDEAVGIAGSTASALRGLPAYLTVLVHWAQMGVPPYTPWGCWPNVLWLGEGALGYLWLLGCVPAVVWMLATRQFTTRRGRLPLLALGVIVATVFVIQPMNHSARYTLWIYALGLPCFALIASRAQAGAIRRARLARLWLSLCLLVLIVEGAFTLTRVVPLALRPSNTIACLKRHYWGRPASYLMPQLSGSVFDEIFAGCDTVALGPLDGHTHDGAQFKIAILGQLSMPLGCRKIFRIGEPIDESAVAGLIRRGVKYVILDADRPLPEVFQRGRFPVDRPPDFLVVTLDP